MLTGLHILLTYKCIFECDHCFVYSSPTAEGTFTLTQMRDALRQAADVDTIDTIYFEGGEPFLFFPLLLESIKLARQLGFQVGIVSNGYFATSEENAALWLRPLVDLDLIDLSFSDDPLHHDQAGESPASIAIRVARRLGLPVGTIAIEEPTIIPASQAGEKGAPIVGGDVRFRGRAVDKMAGGLPTRPWHEFTECPDEDFEHPSRVHLDAEGHIHLCQGVIMGNIWETPLRELLANYDVHAHPIAGPLAHGGPACLVEHYRIRHGNQYVEACHLCYLARLALMDRFPKWLAPQQVYGL